jgi:hypothetical protein
LSADPSEGPAKAHRPFYARVTSFDQAHAPVLFHTFCQGILGTRGA